MSVGRPISVPPSGLDARWTVDSGPLRGVDALVGEVDGLVRLADETGHLAHLDHLEVGRAGPGGEPGLQVLVVVPNSLRFSTILTLSCAFSYSS